MEKRIVVFKIGGELYGVDIATINGIENAKGVTPIPNAVDMIKGIINLRGEVIPIYDLHKKFGKESLTKYDDKTKFIVMNIGDMSLGLEVGEVFNIATIDDEQLHKLPVIITNAEENFISSVANIEGHLVAIVNAKMLLKEAEKESLKAAMDNMKDDKNK